MDSIVVEVYVPATGSIYDFSLSVSAKVGEALRQMIGMLTEIEKNVSFDKLNPMLGDMDSGRVLDNNGTLGGFGITDGSSLILL